MNKTISSQHKQLNYSHGRTIAGVTVVPQLVSRSYHSQYHDRSIVMEHSSQQLWNDRLNSVPCGFQSVKEAHRDVRLQVLNQLFIFHRLQSIFLAKFPPKTAKMQKKGRKDTTIFIKKPYGDAVLAPFSEPLSPRRKVNMLINRYLIKQGDSDRRFVTFYFSISSFVCLIAPYLSGRILLPKIN